MITKIYNMETLYSFLCILVLISTLQVNGDVVWVTTALGRLGGLLIHFIDVDTRFEIGIFQFLGIPYAKPPIGNLRFQKPVPVKAWSTPHYATKWPAACVQHMTMPYPWAMPPESSISEDCLYLNIWAPKDENPMNKKSVLFWIHGGGFFTGSTRQEVYEGKSLAALGDVIVVTANYRLGSLGFWSNNDEAAPGNVGIWDVIAALKWVYQNIESFGGDRDSITIAGEGAGAVIVSLLSTTPHARGLFKRLIMQSGSAIWSRMDSKQATFERSHAVAEKIGCANASFTLEKYPNKVLACMRGVDALAIIKEEGTLNPTEYSSYLPRWGDDLFPRNTREVLLKGQFSFDELLIGNSGNEGAVRLTAMKEKFFGFNGTSDRILNRNESKNFLKDLFETFDDQDRLIKHYIPARVDLAGDKRRHQLQVASALGDEVFVCPTLYYALVSAHSGAKVYYYEFRHKPKHTIWADWMSPTHFDEVDFVFGGPFRHKKTYSKEERSLSRLMIQHWTNFVKNGKPKDDWPEYGKHYQTVVYNDSIETDIVVAPHIYNCKFWRPYSDPDNKINYPDY